MLGGTWPVRRIQNWFQHERSKGNNSKYDGTNLSAEDQTMWNQFVQLYSNGIEGQLVHQIQLAKQRAAILLGSQKVQQLWVDYDFSIQERKPAVLLKLQEVYNNEDYEPTNLNEAQDLSELFECNLLDIPIQQIDKIRRIGPERVFPNKVDAIPEADPIPKEAEKDHSPIQKQQCPWETSYICTCKPQNEQHIKFNIEELQQLPDNDGYFKNTLSRFRSDYIFKDHLLDFAQVGKFVDGVVIDTFLCHINSVMSRPVYFMETKFLGVLQWRDPNFNYMKNKLDKDMMCTANQIFFPVNYHGQHWQLLEFNFTTNSIVLYDGKRYFV